jgi:hypothetical protein
MFFAFLATHLRLYRSSVRSSVRVFHAASVATYLACLALLMSTTGYCLFAASASWLLVRGLKRAPVRVVTAMVVTAAALAWAAHRVLPESFAVFDAVTETLASPDNGFLGRYTAGGRLQPTYDYIANHPFRPIGLTTDPNRVSLGDNAIAEYVIRGSPVLYLAVLLSLWLFCADALHRRSDRAAFFLFFVMSDFGYPLLSYARSVGLLALLAQIWEGSSRGLAPRLDSCAAQRRGAPGE